MFTNLKVSDFLHSDKPSRHSSVQLLFKHKIVNTFLPIYLNMCFGCSKELSHQDGSFEYPQHMFWLRNKKNNFVIYTLVWKPGPGVVSSIPAQLASHTFVEIDHEITSTVILLTSPELFKKGCCQLQAKTCARSTG